MNESTKLYSKQAVMLATFLGGPLGGSILMRRNSLNLGRNREGNIILFIGIWVMILAGAISFSELDERINQSLNLFLPALFVSICFISVEKLYGKALTKHQLEGQPFYSMWRAAGIGGVIMAVILSMMIYSIYVDKNSFDSEAFQSLEVEFFQNQDVVNQLIDLNLSDEDLNDFIDQNTLPKLNRNIELCEKMLALNLQPKGLRTHVELLDQFTRLQIKKFHLIKKELTLTTRESVHPELIDIAERINEIVVKINAVVE